MVMESLIWPFMVCMILCGLVWLSIVCYANVFPCKVLNGLVWPYAAMHNFCACFPKFELSWTKVLLAVAFPLFDTT